MFDQLMDPETWRISAASEATSTSDLRHRKPCYSPHHNFVINRMTPFYDGFISLFALSHFLRRNYRLTLNATEYEIHSCVILVVQC